MTTVTEHVRLSHSAGDGYTEPREYWETCSCGVTIFAWQQFYDESREDADNNWLGHLDWVACGSREGGVGDDLGNCG